MAFAAAARMMIAPQQSFDETKNGNPAISSSVRIALASLSKSKLKAKLQNLALRAEYSSTAWLSPGTHSKASSSMSSEAWHPTPPPPPQPQPHLLTHQFGNAASVTEAKRRKSCSFCCCTGNGLPSALLAMVRRLISKELAIALEAKGQQIALLETKLDTSEVAHMNAIAQIAGAQAKTNDQLATMLRAAQCRKRMQDKEEEEAAMAGGLLRAANQRRIAAVEAKLRADRVVSAKTMARIEGAQAATRERLTALEMMAEGRARADQADQVRCLAAAEAAAVSAIEAASANAVARVEEVLAVSKEQIAAVLTQETLHRRQRESEQEWHSTRETKQASDRKAVTSTGASKGSDVIILKGSRRSRHGRAAGTGDQRRQRQQQQQQQQTSLALVGSSQILAQEMASARHSGTDPDATSLPPITATAMDTVLLRGFRNPQTSSSYLEDPDNVLGPIANEIRAEGSSLTELKTSPILTCEDAQLHRHEGAWPVAPRTWRVSSDAECSTMAGDVSMMGRTKKSGVAIATEVQPRCPNMTSMESHSQQRPPSPLLLGDVSAATLEREADTEFRRFESTLVDFMTQLDGAEPTADAHSTAVSKKQTKALSSEEVPALEKTVASEEANASPDHSLYADEHFEGCWM